MTTSSRFALSLALMCAAAGFAASSESPIVFVSSRAWQAGGTHHELFIMNADGGDIRQIAGPAGPLQLTGIKRNPTWSPDGARVAFDQDGGGAFDGDIYAVTLDAGDPVNVSAHVRRDRQPAWSPDGRLIAFTSRRAGHSDIWVMKADGTAARSLTNDGVADYSPAWSPTGKQIVFLRNPGGDVGGAEPYIMNANGGELRPLMPDHVSAADPAWSPDGGRIAFIDRATSSVFVVDVDGRALRQVTSGPEDAGPTWSPSGRRIMFSSKRGTWRSLYVVNTDGTRRKRLTNDGWDSQPEWHVPPSARAVSPAGKAPSTWGWLKGIGAGRAVAQSRSEGRWLLFARRAP